MGGGSGPRRSSACFAQGGGDGEVELARGLLRLARRVEGAGEEVARLLGAGGERHGAAQGVDGGVEPAEMHQRAAQGVVGGGLAAVEADGGEGGLGGVVPALNPFGKQGEAEMGGGGLGD